MLFLTPETRSWRALGGLLASPRASLGPTRSPGARFWSVLQPDMVRYRYLQVFVQVTAIIANNTYS